MGRFENFTPPTLGSELSTSEITMLEELTALANSGTGEFIRKSAGSLVNSTLSETVALSGLSDVAILSPSSGQVLSYNGSSWVNSSLSETISLSELDDVVISSLAVNNTLRWNGSSWVNAGGVGTVTSVSVVTANGVSGSVADSTTTPAITLTLGAITPTTVNGLTLSLGLGSITTNIAIGPNALNDNTTGLANTAVGWRSLFDNTEGQHNSAYGYQSNRTVTTGSFNTGMGSGSLLWNLTGSGNVGLGYFAGAYETGSNAFYVDNQNRTNTAGDKAGALLYGVFNATPSSQTLKINAGSVETLGTIELGHATDTTIARSGAGAITVEGVQVILSGAALGTPASGTLTNCTGLPLTGLVSDTTTALGIGSINLGHASDTTIARSGAGAITVEGVAVLLSGGALGTPSSGTGTNITGIPAANILAGSFGAGAYVISTSLQAATIELGDATDTTLARVSAGVISVEGVTVPTISSTNTLTNKRVNPRITTIVSNAEPTVNTDDCDCVTITALATAITSMTTNLSGTPVNFQKLLFRIKDDGTARAITWGASFVAKGVALPTTTVISKLLTVGFIYDTVATTWGCIASAQEA